MGKTNLYYKPHSKAEAANKLWVLDAHHEVLVPRYRYRDRRSVKLSNAATKAVKELREHLTNIWAQPPNISIFVDEDDEGYGDSAKFHLYYWRSETDEEYEQRQALIAERQARKKPVDPVVLKAKISASKVRAAKMAKLRRLAKELDMAVAPEFRTDRD